MCKRTPYSISYVICTRHTACTRLRSAIIRTCRHCHDDVRAMALHSRQAKTCVLPLHCFDCCYRSYNTVWAGELPMSNSTTYLMMHATNARALRNKKCSRPLPACYIEVSPGNFTTSVASGNAVFVAGNIDAATEVQCVRRWRCRCGRPRV